MLGHKATDTITGLTGVITAFAEFLHAPKRIELSPAKIHEGKPVEPVWLDEARLKIGKVHTKIGEIPSEVVLGSVVEDKMTGFKGTATGRFIFLNGCVRVEVTPKALKDGRPIEPAVFDEQRLTGKQTGLPGGPRPGPTPYSRP
jgi:hypothetical protein